MNNTSEFSTTGSFKTPDIYGIQQVGLGVADIYEAYEWYARYFHVDLCVFDDASEAVDMAQYMGGLPRSKRAILAMSDQGGAGYELWQATSRPGKAIADTGIQRLGIQRVTLKCRDVNKLSHAIASTYPTSPAIAVVDPLGRSAILTRDPYGNHVCYQECDDWLWKYGRNQGGIYSVSIGVSDINLSIAYYANLLGYDQVLLDETKRWNDLTSLVGGDHELRRVILTHSAERSGGFSHLLGRSEIELIECREGAAHSYEDRYWGDPGYMHICFDVADMACISRACDDLDRSLTVKSDPDFLMGDAAGHWGYAEDPDGTLIEFVQTLKVTLLPALGWKISLHDRPVGKPLPRWMVAALRCKRRKVLA